MKKKTLNLEPIAECGMSKQGSLSISYKEIVDKIFKPNVTELDDPDKVKASWGFKDQNNREGFIWCYKFYGEKEDCKHWSVDGDKDLLIELFRDSIRIG